MAMGAPQMEDKTRGESADLLNDVVSIFSMKLSEIARTLNADVSGEAEVKNVASLKSAAAGDLIYAADPKALSEALQSSASAIIAGEFAREQNSVKPTLIVKNPKLAFARAAKMLLAAKPPAGIDPTAIVAPEAKLGKDVF